MYSFKIKSTTPPSSKLTQQPIQQYKNFFGNTKNIVLYKNLFYSPINDGKSCVITEDFAPKGSTLEALLNEFKDVPINISQHVKLKRVVIQAGGNIGIYVREYANIFEKVYTFEPDPLNFFCLTLNVSNQNVSKFQACLGDTHECVSINNTYSTYGHGGTHVSNNKGDIPTLKIDNLNLNICDLIHLDIEGYEKKAILGGLETITRCKPVIVIENYGPWLQRYNTNLEEIEDILFNVGYKYILSIQGDRLYKHPDNI
jgi:FkbM family methyltransferase